MRTVGNRSHLADRLLISLFDLNLSAFSRAIAPAIFLGFSIPPALWPQNLLRQTHGAGSLTSVDAAILESDGIRKDLPCEVTPLEPFLSFDLRFHSIYRIEVPMKELARAGNELALFLRVTPTSNAGDSVYLSQRFPVPELGRGAGGTVHLNGGFDLGEGQYHVQLLLRDQRGRICSFHWNADAQLGPGGPGIRPAIGAGRIEAYDEHVFRPEPPVARVNRDEALKIKIIANFTPREGNVSGVPTAVADLVGLVGILRNISREPRIASFSIVAFDMNQQRVIFRRNDADRIDFPALGDSVAPLKPGVIQYRQLANPGTGPAFLSDLIEEELAHSDADAVVFAGPNLLPGEGLPLRNVRARAANSLFYLNYNLTPFQTPWRDAIGKIVKQLGGSEYTISRPRDVWTSWEEVMRRIEEQKHASMADSGGCGVCSDH